MYLYIYTREDKLPQIMSEPLSETARIARKFTFVRRGYLEIDTPREDEIATEEEKKKKGWD